MPNVALELRINETVVAQANVNDNEEPSNLAIFYEGEIGVESFVDVTVMSGTRDFIIPVQMLQWGYKLYKSEYNLVTTTDISCV